MKEVIIVAGKNKLEAAWLRHCLRDEGYDSILCETVEEIIEELSTPRSCEVSVLLAVLEPTILKNISDDVINRLSKCGPEVPFFLFEKENSPEEFERICANREKFDWEENPLAKTLEGAGVEVGCVENN